MNSTSLNLKTRTRKQQNTQHWVQTHQQNMDTFKAFVAIHYLICIFSVLQNLKSMVLLSKTFTDTPIVVLTTFETLNIIQEKCSFFACAKIVVIYIRCRGGWVMKGTVYGVSMFWLVIENTEQTNKLTEKNMDDTKRALTAGHMGAQQHRCTQQSCWLVEREREVHCGLRKLLFSSCEEI